MGSTGNVHFALQLSEAASASSYQGAWLIARALGELSDAQIDALRESQDASALAARASVAALTAGADVITITSRHDPVAGASIGAHREGVSVGDVALSLDTIGVANAYSIIAHVLRSANVPVVVSNLGRLLASLHAARRALPCVLSPHPLERPRTLSKIHDLCQSSRKFAKVRLSAEEHSGAIPASGNGQRADLPLARSQRRCSILAPTGFCMAAAAEIEMMRTGLDRGVVPGLNEHAGLMRAYATARESLLLHSQLDLVAGLGRVIAACAAMTAEGIVVERAALALEHPGVASRAAPLSAALRAALALERPDELVIALASGAATLDISHEPFAVATTTQGRTTTPTQTIKRAMRANMRGRPGERVINVDFVSVDFFSSAMLTGAPLFDADDQYGALAESIFIDEALAAAVPAAERRSLVKTLTMAALFGGDAFLRQTLTARGVDEPGAERFLRLVKRRLCRDALTRAVDFTPAVAVGLDGGLVARPSVAGLDAAARREADAKWKRTAVNLAVARTSSLVCRAAIVVLYEAMTLGLSPARAAALRAAAPSCAPALVLMDGGRVRLDAKLTWWLHDAFYMTAREAVADAVAAAARVLVVESAEAAAAAQMVALAGRAHAHFGGLRTIVVAGARRPRFPAKAVVSDTYAP